MLIDGRPTVRSRIVWTIFVSCCLVVAACAAPAGSPSGGQAGEAAAPAGEKVELEMWIPIQLGDEPNISETQLEQFMEENPEVDVKVSLFNSDTFDEKVITAAEAGVLPDLLAGTHYHVAHFHQRGILESLEDLKVIWPDSTDINDILNDFLPDALDSSMFPDASSSDRLLRAIPWRRYGCTPKYLSLARPKDGDYPEEAHKLIEFLARVDIQIATFKELGRQTPRTWPTRIEAYKQLQGEGVVCPDPEVQVHRLYSLETIITLAYIEDDEQIGSLQAQIAGVPSAVLLLNDEDRRAIEYGDENPENIEIITANIQAAAVPVVLGGDRDLWRNKADSFVEDLAQPGSATVGALLIQYDWEGIPPGAYIVDCTTAGPSAPQLDCKTIDANNNAVDVASYGLTAQWEDTQSDVGYPIATYETGSPGRFCFYIDGRKCCIGR